MGFRELIERQNCCELLYLPPYSRDFNPIEEAFAKIKSLTRKAQARSREALLEAMGKAIWALTNYLKTLRSVAILPRRF